MFIKSLYILNLSISLYTNFAVTRRSFCTYPWRSLLANGQYTAFDKKEIRRYLTFEFSTGRFPDADQSKRGTRESIIGLFHAFDDNLIPPCLLVKTMEADTRHPHGSNPGLNAVRSYICSRFQNRKTFLL